MESPRKRTQESIVRRRVLSKASIQKGKNGGQGPSHFSSESLGFPDARAEPLLCQRPDLLIRTGLT
ncbi:uncharacterized protein N7500_008208 [Penicillium coprophilum]|uniref:uncharacterized protein n=1 Tax=Penicillium coprophilum TaxID=36646 RepID=UPI00239E6A10|nr:uncharacterized protein N7500_008208 [Penicillium coprophilum]KAJ5158557.1 hypothetical protein N7500_008208 [Penicillium coprophilum]